MGGAYIENVLDKGDHIFSVLTVRRHDVDLGIRCQGAKGMGGRSGEAES